MTYMGPPLGIEGMTAQIKALVDPARKVVDFSVMLAEVLCIYKDEEAVDICLYCCMYIYTKYALPAEGWT